MVIVLVMYILGILVSFLWLYSSIMKDGEYPIATRITVLVLAVLLWPITLYHEIKDRRKKYRKEHGIYVSIHTWDDMCKISKHKPSNTEIKFRHESWTHLMEGFIPNNRIIIVTDGTWKIKEGLTLKVPAEAIKDSGPLVLYKLLRSNDELA